MVMIVMNLIMYLTFFILFPYGIYSYTRSTINRKIEYRKLYKVYYRSLRLQNIHPTLIRGSWLAREI